MIRRGKKSNDPILFDVWRKCEGMGIMCQMCVGMIFCGINWLMYSPLREVLKIHLQMLLINV